MIPLTRYLLLAAVVATGFTVTAFAQNNRRSVDASVTEVSTEKGQPIQQSGMYQDMDRNGEVPILKNIPIINSLFKKKEKQDRGLKVGELRRIDTGEVVQDEKRIKNSRPKHLSDLPLLSKLFQSKPGTSKPIDDRKKALKETPFLQRRQAEYILANVPGIESIEMIETRTTNIGRKTAETGSKCDLFFTGTDEAKAKARAIVNNWDSQDGRIVEMKFYLIERSRDDIKEPISTEFHALPMEAYKRILSETKEDSRATIINAPKLSVFHGQHAHVSIMNEIAYVKDFDVEIGNSSVIADPIIGTVKDGIRIDATPVIDPDGKGVAMDFKVEISSVKRPIQTFTTNLVGNEEVTIQLPEVFLSTRQSEDLVLKGNYMAFRVAGLRGMRDDWDSDDNVMIEVIGAVKVIDKK